MSTTVELDLQLDTTVLSSDLFVEQEETRVVGPPTPYLFINHPLSVAEGHFITRITNGEFLTGENSLPFYITVQDRLEHIGRFDLSNLKNITRFRYMRLDVLLVTEPGANPINLCSTDNMKKLVRINKHLDES